MPPPDERIPGVTGPPRRYELIGCRCAHEPWEHRTDRRGCAVSGCKCTGWWTSRLEEAS